MPANENKKIKNFNDLASSKARRTALEIIEAGLKAIDTESVIKASVRFKKQTLYIKNKSFQILPVSRLMIVGVGKCSLEAGRALEEILGDRIDGGIVVDVHPGALQRIKTFAGSHPFPTEKNVDATREIIKLISGLNKNDLVIFIVSGGGSTLLCQPQNFTCQEESKIIEFLFEAGVGIREINIIRKHLSVARGGYLAKYVYPAKGVALIFSDIPGGELEFVASGPTMRDTTTITDAQKIINKLDHNNKFDFIADELIETPKEKKYFRRISDILLVSNKIALKAMKKRAEALGFRARIITDNLSGEASRVGEKIVKQLDRASSKSVFLYGGETTVELKNKGKGGRNQELGLSALRFLKDDQLIAAVASDGRDNTDFAGVICDKITKERTKALGLNPDKYLNENQSYLFFSAIGSYIVAGDTGSNVSDLILAIKE